MQTIYYSQMTTHGHLLPRLVILFSFSFQYKILKNVLHLNKKLFTFQRLTSSLCPICKLSDETVLYLFYECNIIQNLWNDLALFFENDSTLDLKPQAAFLGFLKDTLPSKYLLVLKTSWRRLQHVVSVTIFCVARRLEDVLKTSRKTSCRHVLKTFSKRLGDKKMEISVTKKSKCVCI